MIELIANYWVTFLLGIVSGALVFLCKKFYKLWQNEKEHQKSKEQEAFYEGIKETIREESRQSRSEEQNLQKQINLIKDGVLSIQGKAFKQECRQFLQPNAQFSVEEFETLQQDHQTYNSLGGNHDGDILYSLVEKKAAIILTDDK